MRKTVKKSSTSSTRKVNRKPKIKVQIAGGCGCGFKIFGSPERVLLACERHMTTTGHTPFARWSTDRSFVYAVIDFCLAESKLIILPGSKRRPA